MALITWEDRFSVGSPSMDGHHKKLFDILNRMHDAMKAGEAADRIRGLISELLDYTIYHFGEEEKMMEAHGYSGLAEQKHAHQVFIDKIKEFKEEAEGDMAIFVVSKVSTTAMEWLMEHILVMDKKYEDTLKGL